MHVVGTVQAPLLPQLRDVGGITHLLHHGSRITVQRTNTKTVLTSNHNVIRLYKRRFSMNVITTTASFTCRSLLSLPSPPGPGETDLGRGQYLWKLSSSGSTRAPMAYERINVERDGQVLRNHVALNFLD